MKIVKTLALVSLLAATQSFAFSKTERNILLGLGAGAIIVHVLESQNDHLYKSHNNKVVYINSRNFHRKHKRHHMRKHYSHGHHYYSRANDYYRNDYKHNTLAFKKHTREVGYRH